MRPGVVGRRECGGRGFDWLPVRSAALLGPLAAVTAGVLLNWSAHATAHSLGEDPLVPTGQLLRSDAPDGHALFSSVAMSGGVLVAGMPAATVEANQFQDAAYLLTEPAGGWSTETENAKLVASDGQAGDQFGGLVAISGDTVVVSGAAQATARYVFTKPPGGWSGPLHESARPTVTDPTAGPRGRSPSPAERSWQGSRARETGSTISRPICGSVGDVGQM